MIVDVLQKIGKPFVGVCSYGRSGSSLLMKFLDAAGVAVLGTLPFEDRTSQASLIAAVRLQFGLAIQVPNSEQTNHQTFKGDFYRSSIPTNAETLPKLIAEYEEFLKNATSGGRIGIAEKFIGTELLQIFRAYDGRDMVKPIFLIRDPRDIFISVKEFNKKRGFDGFSASGNDASLFQSICGFSLWQARQAEKFGALICYYEDLILRRPQSLLALLQYIGAHIISSDQVDEIWQSIGLMEGAKAHMTSNDALTSISRWKTKEFEEFHSLFNQAKKQISQIGYL
jgi:hypothetical protein